MTDFERFWKAYPRKIGRLEAERKFEIALRSTTIDVLLAAVERYKQHKPEYADWCHAKTWLYQGRWLDEYEDAKPSRKPVLRSLAFDTFRQDPTWDPDRDCPHGSQHATRGVCQAVSAALKRESA
jgi:hypothetical protein